MNAKIVVVGLFLVISGCTKERSATSAPSVASPSGPSTKAPCCEGALQVDARVASLLQPKSEVSFRTAHELVWNKATDKMGLKNYDSIKTGVASSGVLHYSDDTMVTVNEKSLVIVLDRSASANSETSIVALPAGTIGGNLKGSSQKKVELVVRTARGWVKASASAGGETRFEAKVGPGGDLEVKSHGGAISVVAKGKEKTIRANESLTVKAPAALSGMPPSDPERASANEFSEMPEVEEKAFVANGGKHEKTSTSVSRQKAAATKPLPVAKGDVFKILEPKPKQVVSADSITVKGVASGRMKAYLNGLEVKPDAGGNFSMPVSLNPGINLLTFQIVGPSKDKVRYETREVTRK